MKKLWEKLKFSNGLPIVELQGKSGREQSIRIDGNQAAQSLPESGRPASPGEASGDASSSASSSLGEDQAQFSGVQGQVQALVGQALQFPEIRQEKVNALRQVVLGGNYQPGSKQVADALFAHLLATPAA